MARIALAAALLLALAIPAGIAPQAASAATTSSCVKAAKSVRTAKSKLKRAQRRAKLGKASRASVARARKALGKAQRAKRRACAAPAKPGVPSAPPAPSKPSTGGPAGPTPPPPPPPTPPTSHALIEKALAEGRIDAETALRYKVFAEFGDTRLPAEFRGSALAVTDTGTLDEVTASWDQLSAATRAALDPFFIPPFNPGSWYEPGSPAGVRAQALSAAATPGQPGSDLCDNTAPDMNRWGYVTAASGKLRVWYENTRAGQQAKAISVAEYLDAGAWTKVISVFREPKPDGGDLDGQRCRGFDPAVDIVLSSISQVHGRTLGYFDKGGCLGPIPGFVLVGRELTGKTLMSTVVHELAHLAHYAYSGDHCRPGIGWLTEATAAWTENHVGGLGPEHPELFAPWFLDRPKLPLETYERDSVTPRHYGAYLFFQWLAKNKGPEALSQVWHYTESGDHPIDTTQQVLRDLGYSDGFKEAWKRFALAGLNPRPQVDWFKQWGLPRGAAIDNDLVLAGDTLALPVKLPHLSAQYHDLSVSQAVKGIEVANPLAGVPGASVQAWLRINDGGQERIEVRDLTDAEKTTFCRDLQPENVQEIALVIANGTSADRTHVLNGDVTVRGSRSCGAYDGHAKITIAYDDGLTEVYTVDYGVQFQWLSTPPGGGTETFFLGKDPELVNATWTMSGVSSSDGCTYSGSEHWPAGSPGFEAMLWLHDFGKGDPRTKYENGFGAPYKIGTVHRSCPTGYEGDQFRQLGHGFMSESHPWDPSDQGMTGSETRDHDGVTLTYEWTMSRKEIGP